MLSVILIFTTPKCNGNSLITGVSLIAYDVEQMKYPLCSMCPFMSFTHVLIGLSWVLKVLYISDMSHFSDVTCKLSI